MRAVVLPVDVDLQRLQIRPVQHDRAKLYRVARHHRDDLLRRYRQHALRLLFQLREHVAGRNEPHVLLDGVAGHRYVSLRESFAREVADDGLHLLRRRVESAISMPWSCVSVT